MKKLLIVILSVFLLFSLTSCNDDTKPSETVSSSAGSGSDTQTTSSSNKNGEETVKPDTTMSAEESSRLEGYLSSSADDLKNFSFTLVKYTYNGKTTEKSDTVTVVYCNKGWAIYTNKGDNGSLYLNDGPKYYSFNLPKKTKTLIVKGEYVDSSISWDASFASYGAMLTAHTAYDASQFHFQREEKIAGRNCIKYAIVGGNISDDSQITYWVDKETGLLLKSITRLKTPGVTSLNMWEISSFKIGEQNLDTFTDLKG